MEQFEAYLQYLLIGLAEKRESILNIFRIWDGIFFPNGKDSLSGKAFSSRTAESTRDALAALAEDAIEDRREEQNGMGDNAAEDNQTDP